MTVYVVYFCEYNEPRIYLECSHIVRRWLGHIALEFDKDWCTSIVWKVSVGIVASHGLPRYRSCKPQYVTSPYLYTMY